MLKCRACGAEKEDELFTMNNGTRSRLCKKCNVRQVQNYYRNNPDKYELNKKSARGKRPNWHRHKMTEDQHRKLLVKQNNLCAVCKTEEPYAIDHNHLCCPGGFSCGKCVRGLLCLGCNTALGSVKESTEILYNMIEYVKSFGSIV